MELKYNKRSFWQRLFGKCITELPSNDDCWKFEGGSLIVDLSKSPELKVKAGAIRIESDQLPDRVLVVHGSDDKYHAFKNRCTHGKRRLDPVPESETVQCCSVGKSTFDYEGQRLAGSANDPLTIYAVDEEDNKLVINVK